MAYSFMKALREDSRFKKSLIIALIENQQSHQATEQFETWMSDFPPINFVHNPRDKENHVGVPTTFREKQQYIYKLFPKLARREILIDTEPVGPFPDASFQALSQQLKTYAWKWTQVADEDIQEGKLTAGGKHRGNDDLAMTLQLLNFHIHTAHQDPVTQKFLAAFHGRWLSEEGVGTQISQFVAAASQAVEDEEEGDG